MITTETMQLTPSEKQVLYALIRYPELSDVKVSEKTKISKYTVTSIRQRFEKKNVFKTVRIPNYQRLGCELLTVRYGDFNPLSTWEQREKIAEKLAFKYNYLFFRISTDKTNISLNVSNNYTQIKDYIDAFERSYHKHNFFDLTIQTHIFLRLNTAKIFRFFDFSTVVNERFQLGQGESITQQYSAPCPVISLTKNEQKVFVALLAHPDHTDQRIADITGFSRQTISHMRKKFEREELYRIVRIPDLRLLGSQFLVMLHCNMNPEISLEERLPKTQKLFSSYPHFFVALENLDEVYLSAVSDYQDIQHKMGELISFYKKNNFLLGEPTIKIYSYPDVKSIIFNRFAPSVQEIFDAKDS